MKKLFLILIMTAVLVFGCKQSAPQQMGEKSRQKDSMDIDKEKMENMGIYNSQQDAEFRQMCQSKGWQWMLMKPTMNSKIMNDAKECWGCMVEGIEHVCDKQKFMEMVK